MVPEMLSVASVAAMSMAETRLPEMVTPCQFWIIRCEPEPVPQRRIGLEAAMLLLAASAAQLF